MVTAENLLDIIPAMSVAIALIYYAMTLRNANKTQRHSLETRQAQLFMQVYDKFMSPYFLDAWATIMPLQYDSIEQLQGEKFGHETNKAFSTMVNFFEGVGVLVKEDLVDIRLVAELMTLPTIAFWKKTEDSLEEIRAIWRHPRWLSETEYLYNELMRFISENPEFRIPDEVYWPPLIKPAEAQ